METRMEKYYLQENNNSIEIRDRNVSEMWAHLAAVDIKAGQNMVLHRSKDKEDTWTFRGEWLQMDCVITEEAGECCYLKLQTRLCNISGQAVSAALRLELRLQDEGEGSYMIPGMFYGTNRFQESVVCYPGLSRENADCLNGWSDRWAFASDRTPIPVVWGSGKHGMAGFACCDHVRERDILGVGFAEEECRSVLEVNIPYREGPVKYVANDQTVPKGNLGRIFAPEEQRYLDLEAGEAFETTLWIYMAQNQKHGYEKFHRELYYLFRDHNRQNPWMSAAKAAELTAYGLYHWHYQPEYDVIYETVAFDREANLCAGGHMDRKHMHISWISGIPHAFALLRQGKKEKNKDYEEAAVRVLDHIAEGICPCGLFWGQWTLEKGWDTGWNPDPGWVQANTLAEGVLYLIRAVEDEKKTGRTHTAWEKAIQSNLDFIVKHMREDGNTGSYYDACTGQVKEWEGAAGLLWAAALAEGYRTFGKEAYRYAAGRAGEYFSRFVEDELIYGAPEDCHLLPNSEDGYNGVIAYIALYELDRKEKWLELARKAADWTLTFRWIFNIVWPEYSILRQYDYRSFGSDHASPSNNHLHNYGLICFREFEKLARYTGDTYYSQRNKEHLLCFLQFIAREDGDFNAYKGMMTERYYNADYIQKKGMMLTLSHAWCIGLTLYACQETEGFRTYHL